ncbi:hypothetical protein MBN60_01645, partial [Candidatus Saccharibacteria bacterium]|nr:hypothetical protein [Candidatus Saccharibacteria bacterium]
MAMNQDALSKFISDIIDAKGYKTLDSDVRRQLEQDLKNRLLDQIDRAVLEALPENKIDGFNDLLDRGASQQEIQQYIANSGVDT